MKTLYSYYEHCEGRSMEDETRLILVWREHHERLGIRTVILTEAHARKSKDFLGYAAAIDGLVSQPRSDARPTFMRWLAMAELGGPLMQYNTFLYPETSDDINPMFSPDVPINVVAVFSAAARPSLVFGQRDAYGIQAARFASCKVKNGAILSDADIVMAQSKALPESISLLPIVKDYGEDGWNKAIAVRYPRNVLVRDGFLSAWRAVPDIRKYSVPART